MSGRYRVLRRLGQGAMAEVFLAELTGRDGAAAVVAIKRPLPHLLAEPEVMKLFVDEARLCARLDHPVIASMIEVGEQDGEPYLALEYVEGAPLRRVLEQGALPAGAAAWLGHQAALGLAYAHDAVADDPVVHRDVTPNNLLVGRAGEVKLIDFGVARARGRLRKTATGAVVGTQGYLAPEQLTGGALTPALDVFALGVVLFEAISGGAPFKDRSPRKQLERMVKGELAPLPATCPPALQALLRAMLAASPESRPPARRVAAHLASWADEGQRLLAARAAELLPPEGDFDDGTVTAAAPVEGRGEGAPD